MIGLDRIAKPIPSLGKKYTTPIDEFYAFIQNKKQTSLSKAAEHVKVNKRIAGEWAKILNESGLIELTYPVFGEPTLKWKEH